MKTLTGILATLIILVLIPGAIMTTSGESLDEMKIISGPVNGVLLQRGCHTLSIYGVPDSSEKVDIVLFTHHRRDVAWAGEQLVL